VFAITVLLCLHAYYYFDFRKKWDSARQIPDTKEKIVAYEKLYANKFNSPDFIKNYVLQLIADSSYAKASTVLMQSQQRLNRYEFNMFLAEAAKGRHQIQQAIQSYEEAHFIIPNRFLPSYNLMKIYQGLGDKENTEIWKMTITRTPVKIKSEITDLIKQEANSIK
jgi:hypothetical protein